MCFLLCIYIAAICSCLQCHWYSLPSSDMLHFVTFNVSVLMCLQYACITWNHSVQLLTHEYACSHKHKITTHTHLQTLIYNKCHISSISHISFLKPFTTQVTDQHQAADVYLIQSMHLHNNNTRATLSYRNKCLTVQNNGSSLCHQFLPCYYDLRGWLNIENH